MATLSYPSDTAPALASISIDVPPGWSPMKVPDVLLAARAASDGATFCSNVTVSSQRLLDGVALADVEEELLTQLLATYPDLEEADRFAGEHRGLDARVAEYAFTEPKAGTLLQIQGLVLTNPRAGFRDLVQLHATCAASRAVHEVDDLRSIFRTLRVG